MLRDTVGDAPSWMRRPQAHHDLPLEHELKFLKVGLDPNSYGRWVPADQHSLWHNAAGTKFNEVWGGFFTDFPDATRSQVLEKLDEMKQAYEVIEP